MAIIETRIFAKHHDFAAAGQTVSNQSFLPLEGEGGKEGEGKGGEGAGD